MPTYPGISSEAFRHPLDRQAEEALRSVPGFDLVARKFVEYLTERPQYVYQVGNSIQVGPRQYASIYQIFRECLRDLDIYPEPNLFVSQSPIVNAFALGEDFPFIVLNSGLLDLLSEAELRTVIAHELGHLKCGHTTLIQMAIWTTQVISGLADRTFGLSMLVSSGLVLAFYEWLRKAELSADRAALLVMDDLSPIMGSMMRVAGGSSRYGHELSLPELNGKPLTIKTSTKTDSTRSINSFYTIISPLAYSSAIPSPSSECISSRNGKPQRSISGSAKATMRGQVQKAPLR